MLEDPCDDLVNERCSLPLGTACIQVAADPAARSVLSLWSAYLASSAFFSLLAESVRAKRARRVESLPFLLICLCLNEDSFWLAGLMMLSEGLTYRGLLRIC
jgi:hypothetical protein